MPNLNNTKIPKELELEVCNLYASGKYSFERLGIMYNCSGGNIRNICKRNNAYVPVSKGSKNKCNDNYFETIQFSHQAYLLGLISADGHLSKNKSLVIRLNLKDKELLEKVNFYLESDYKIQTNNEFDKRTNKTYDHCSLMIYRDKIADDLLKLGIGNNKSVDLKLPNIPKHLMRDYIRGMVCGDGNWFINEGNMIIWKLVSSTKSILEEIQIILMKELSLSETNIVFDTGCYRLIYCGNDTVRKIFDYLYKDVQDELYLKRKYNYARTHFYNLDNGIKSRNKHDAPVSRYGDELVILPKKLEQFLPVESSFKLPPIRRKAKVAA